MTEQSLLTGFSAFTSGLQRVLCGSSMVYTRDLGISGLLILDLSTINLPTLSVFLDVEDGTCGMWKGMLTEATMTDHFENECNIYEDSGLGALAGIFATALQGNITTEKLQSGNILSLNLEYDFGSKIRGALKLPLIRLSLPTDILTAIKSLSVYHIPTNKCILYILV